MKKSKYTILILACISGALFIIGMFTQISYVFAIISIVLSASGWYIGKKYKNPLLICKASTVACFCIFLINIVYFITFLIISTFLAEIIGNII